MWFPLSLPVGTVLSPLEGIFACLVVLVGGGFLREEEREESWRHFSRGVDTNDHDC